MVCHLNLPWDWENCVDSGCCKAVHLSTSPDEASKYPRKWVEAFLGNCEITSDYICLMDDQGFYHNDDGPAVEYHDGDMEWWEHGSRRTPPLQHFRVIS